MSGRLQDKVAIVVGAGQTQRAGSVTAHAPQNEMTPAKRKYVGGMPNEPAGGVSPPVYFLSEARISSQGFLPLPFNWFTSNELCPVR